MDDQGYGRCRKMDHMFDGEYSCYLDENSKCEDAKYGQNKTNGEKKTKSAIACQGKINFIRSNPNFGVVIIYILSHNYFNKSHFFLHIY